MEREFLQLIARRDTYPRLATNFDPYHLPIYEKAIQFHLDLPIYLQARSTHLFTRE